MMTQSAAVAGRSVRSGGDTGNRLIHGPGPDTTIPREEP